MRVRVRSSWRTAFLLLLAAVAAGLIAWFEAERRLAAERAPQRPDAPHVASPDGGTWVELEVAP